MALGLRCETLHQFKDVPADVVGLFARAELSDPQFGLGWFQNLTDTTFAGDAGVKLHVLRLNGAPLAALPLHLKAATGGNMARALGNFYTCLYAPSLAPGVTADQLAELLRHIKREHAPLASLALSPLDDEPATLQLLQTALRLAGLRTYQHHAFGNWYLPVSGNSASYMASRPGEVRSTLKRMSKKFAAAGGRFEIVVEPSQVDAAIAAYTSVYNSSWKRPEPFEQFMPGLARVCAAQGWLRLGLAWIDERPVAAQFWIVSGGKAHIYKLAYDNDYRHLSPGSLLTAQLMQRVIDEDKVREIDYMKGDDAYKNQWMTHRRERMGLLAFNPHTMGGLVGLAREATGRGLVALKLRKRPDTDTPTAQTAPAAAAS